MKPGQFFDMSSHVAMVTGAGKGIGRACAEVLSHAGAEVIAVARTQADLDSLVEQGEGRVTAWAADVTEPAFLERVNDIERLDVLVNNVGTNVPQPFVDVEADVLDRVLGINVRAAFLTSQAAARVMVKRGSGSIIHMSSQMGHIGAPNRTVYCMTKHAIEGLTKAMAVELAPAGVRVNSVAPTFIETPLVRPMLEKPEFHQYVMDRIPLGKIGKPEDVAAAVLFLASSASSMVTGDSLKVDGGWTAQ